MELENNSLGNRVYGPGNGNEDLACGEYDAERLTKGHRTKRLLFEMIARHFFFPFYL